MSDAYVAQWTEQSTGNQKTWARTPAQSKASFFPQKDFKFFKILNNPNIRNLKVVNILELTYVIDSHNFTTLSLGIVKNTL